MKNLFTRIDTSKGKIGMYAMVAFTALVSLIAITARAQENAAPTIGTIVTAIGSGGDDIGTDPLILTEATTTPIYVHGTATDADGFGDIDAANQYTMKTYRTPVGSGCTASGRDCYANTGGTGVTLTNCGAGTTCDFEITVGVQYYADATAPGAFAYADDDWTASVTVADDSSAIGSSSDTFEIATLTALNVTASVDYLTLALDAYSAQKTITVTDTGNEIIDYLISAPDMSCDQGTIVTGNTHYSLNSNFGTTDPGPPYADGTVMTDTPAAVNASVAVASDGGGNTVPLYTILHIPEDGVKGACSNNITFTATTNGG